MVEVPVSHELTEFSSNKPQASVCQESGQHATVGFQIPISSEQTELHSDESQVGLHQESVVCLTNKLQIPMREFSIIGSQVSMCT